MLPCLSLAPWQAPDAPDAPVGCLINAAEGAFFFAGDVVLTLERAAAEAIPPLPNGDKQAETSGLRAGQGDEYRCGR